MKDSIMIDPKCVAYIEINKPRQDTSYRYYESPSVKISFRTSDFVGNRIAEKQITKTVTLWSGFYNCIDSDGNADLGYWDKIKRLDFPNSEYFKVGKKVYSHGRIVFRRANSNMITSIICDSFAKFNAKVAEIKMSFPNLQIVE